MIKRSHIRQFLAVVDAGSFTQAAARMRLTQPTLSAGIAELERQTGMKLLERSRKQVRLTEAGGRFLRIARGLEQDFRQLDNFGRNEEVEWPDLKLGVLRTLSVPMFAAMLKATAGIFRPEIIDGSDAELRAGLASGRIHCAVTLLHPDETGPCALPLYTEPYRMMVTAGHRLAGTEPVEVAEFASEIMIARRSCEVLTETSNFFTGNGVRPRFAYRSEDDARCMALVAAGHGMTTAPLSLAIAGTVPIRIRGYDFSRRIGLVCDEDWHRQSGRAGTFLQLTECLETALKGISRTPAF